jgi:hypothetical protein
LCFPGEFLQILFLKYEDNKYEQLKITRCFHYHH